eukprot:CAMPEP_0115737550 /NCGR_PEP_ID=MMETSP0272-20121206/87875_1 /TAXON_ID=71861 /ORGANISM="Scrippsiella trochoidea, Strain CCMP3099" /LENGTH=205 /DNA_ID=CAMNT_0003181855 /DNA_START=81 /DNA_END=696 /DNA_ORIENTATION=+
MVCWDVEKTGTCTREGCKWCAGAPDPPKGKGKGKATGSWSAGGTKWSGKWGGGSQEEMMNWMYGMMSQMKGKGKGWGGAKTFKADDSGGVLGEFTGTIRSFSEKNWYGFIDCEGTKELGHADIFLHGDEKRGYRVGHTVKFTAYLTAEGKPQAKDLKSGLKDEALSDGPIQRAAECDWGAHPLLRAADRSVGEAPSTGRRRGVSE